MDDPLVKFVIFLPLYYNDGTEVSNEVILDFQEELFLLADGYTIAGTVEGAYRMANGKKQIDHSLHYSVCISDDKAEELRELVARFGELLGQESMYLERTGSSIDFVPPSNEGEEKK